jgi:hypothetical protein
MVADRDLTMAFADACRSSLIIAREEHAGLTHRERCHPNGRSRCRRVGTRPRVVIAVRAAPALAYEPDQGGTSGSYPGVPLVPATRAPRTVEVSGEVRR